MRKLIPIIVAVFVSVAFAQSITPEYMTWDLPTIQRKYADLLTENARQRVEIAQLRKQVADAKAATEKKPDEKTDQPSADDPKIQEAIDSHTLIVGMTIEQADKSLGLKGIMRNKVSANRSIFIWKIPGEKIPGDPSGVKLTWVASVYKGKLLIVSRHPGLNTTDAGFPGDLPD